MRFYFYDLNLFQNWLSWVVCGAENLLSLIQGVL
jgi:hypothetical protein